LASRGWSCRDAGQHGANPGHPAKSGTVATLVVAAASDAVRHVQSVVSKKRGDYASYDQCIRAKIGLTGKSAILKCSEFSTLENCEIKMQRKNSVLQYVIYAAEYGLVTYFVNT